MPGEYHRLLASKLTMFLILGSARVGFEPRIRGAVIRKNTLQTTRRQRTHSPAVFIALVQITKFRTGTGYNEEISQVHVVIKKKMDEPNPLLLSQIFASKY